MSGSVDAIVAVVGPTATGKSDLAISLALALRGEVVNADAMQLYRGMDIGTAKVPEAARLGVQHHLLDVMEVTETATVAEYQALARATIADITGAGHRPILAGGSSLYVRAVIDDFTFPGYDAELRSALERELAIAGSQALHARLADVDPQAAAQILPTNGRRIVRALEVIAITGAPYPASLPSYDSTASNALQIGLAIDRTTLDTRIDERVDAMWQAGIVDEVRALLDAGLAAGRTASRALGYRQIIDMLQGRTTDDEARAATKRATRIFARRQERTFRRDPRVHWIAYDDPELLDRALAQVSS